MLYDNQQYIDFFNASNGHEILFSGYQQSQLKHNVIKEFLWDINNIEAAYWTAQEIVVHPDDHL